MTHQRRVAVVCSHPIQYFAPWFRWLSDNLDAALRVFYLDNPAVRDAADPGFGQAVTWDTPLLEGYDNKFVENTAASPGTHHYRGLRNPGLWPALNRYGPAATLLMTYRYESILPAMLRDRLPPNTWLRGDSTLLARTEGFRRRLADRVIRRAFRSLTGALFVGQHNRAYFRHHGIDDQRLHRSPPAVDPEHFSPAPQVREEAAAWRNRLRLERSQPLVLFVGKLQSIKRPLLVLSAFRRARLGHAALAFVGSGELGDELRAAVGDDPQVHLLGFRNQGAMPAIYAAADLLVLPSVSETWGLVVNEAFAMGLPALVSDRVGCAPDMIADRDTGAVFAHDNEGALAAALGEALAQPERLAGWGRNAQALSAAEFSFAAMSQGVVQMLEQA